jgi:hypothetical protein
MADSIRDLLLARGYRDAPEMQEDELGQLWAIVMKVEERRSKPRERRATSRATANRESEPAEPAEGRAGAETTMSAEAVLRDHLVKLLTSPWAHVTAKEGLAGVPPDQRGSHLPGHPHTIWQLLEHVRICQDDLVEYSRDPDHHSPNFPEGYWPGSDAPEDEEAWEASVAAFREGLREMVALVRDLRRDLFEPFPWSDEGHTLLREALILADHNAYHLGQIVQLKKALGAATREDL